MEYYINYNKNTGKILGFLTKKAPQGESLGVTKDQWEQAQGSTHLTIGKDGSYQSYKENLTEDEVFKREFLLVDKARFDAYRLQVDPLLNEARIKFLLEDTEAATEYEERALQIRAQIQEAKERIVSALKAQAHG